MRRSRPETPDLTLPVRSMDLLVVFFGFAAALVGVGVGSVALFSVEGGRGARRGGLSGGRGEGVFTTDFLATGLSSGVESGGDENSNSHLVWQNSFMSGDFSVVSHSLKGSWGFTFVETGVSVFVPGFVVGVS